MGIWHYALGLGSSTYLSSLGALAVYIGLFLFGVGVVPIAMLATLFKGMWSTLGELVFLTILTYGARLVGAFVLTKAANDIYI